VGQRPCSCEGSNENCMFCFGRGFVELESKGSQKPSTFVPRFLSRRRGRPRRSVNRSAGLSAGKLGSALLVPCPHCPAKVKATNLKRHVIEVHRKGPGTRKALPLGPSSGRGFGPSRADKHSSKVLPPDYTSRDVFEQTVGVDRRDRTRGIGHVVRENGRYGSHPIHDGFDDESGPE
jgi:hypothetical protein